MAQIELKGLNVTLGEPVVVSEAVGHLHFPGISQFPGGELLISASIVPDRAGNQISAQRIFISKDGGASWDFRYTVTEAHANAKLPRPQNDLLMKPSRLTPDQPVSGETSLGLTLGTRTVANGSSSKMEPCESGDCPGTSRRPS